MPQGGNFWSGIAEGYLSSRRESDLQAKEEETNTKKQYFNILAGMVDKVEPESQGLLFKEMGNILGMKGKQKGIWDFISGAAQQGRTQAVHDEFQNFMGKSMTPEQAKNIEARQDVAGLGWSNQEAAAQMQQQAGQQLQEGIRFRDPRAEKMEDFGRQKEIMRENASILKEQEDRNKMERAQFEHESKIKQIVTKAEEGLQSNLRSQAYTMAAAPESEGGLGANFNPNTEIPVQYFNKAAQVMLAKDALEGGATMAKIQALTGNSGQDVYMNPSNGSISLTAVPGYIPIKASTGAGFINSKIADYRRNNLDNQQIGYRVAQEVVQSRAKGAAARSTINSIISAAQQMAAKSGLTISFDEGSGNPVISDSTGKVYSASDPTIAFKAGFNKDKLTKLRDAAASVAQSQQEQDGLSGIAGALGVRTSGLTAPAQPQAPAAKAPATKTPATPKTPGQKQTPQPANISWNENAKGTLTQAEVGSISMTVGKILKSGGDFYKVVGIKDTPNGKVFAVIKGTPK